MTTSIRLIGIGQPLRGDDALGLEAVQAWQQQHQAGHPTVEVLTLESPGLKLLDALVGCSAAIIVDAVRSNGKAGDIYMLSEADLASFSPAAASAHGLGVAETLALGRSLYPDQLPRTIQLIGIEAQTVGVGDPISRAGRQALPEIVEQIQQVLAGTWTSFATNHTSEATPAGD